MNFAINTNKFNLCHLSVTNLHFTTTTTTLLYFSTASKIRKDYYKILGVSRGSSPEQIKEAFYKLSKKYHPDVNQDKEKASKNFHKVSEAYEVLGSKERRLAYDSLNAAATPSTRIYKTTHSQKTEKWEKDWSEFQNMSSKRNHIDRQQRQNSQQQQMGSERRRLFSFLSTKESNPFFDKIYREDAWKSVKRIGAGFVATILVYYIFVNYYYLKKWR
uniref:J domain-containing protein n=1 Tax=Meloidogyne incognita TaxID=6306 RepID=A0A914KQ16_MELIC